MAKETKLKKNIMKKIKGFTPAKYFVGDVLLIDCDEIYQGLVIGARLVNKSWEYIIEKQLRNSDDKLERKLEYYTEDDLSAEVITKIK